MTIQIPTDHYEFKKYVYPDRWVSYWHQIDEVFDFTPETVLLVGKGDGAVERELEALGVTVTVLDIDSELKPDIVASVEDMPSPDNSFDVVLCAEVLEHLPFEKFDACIAEIARTARKGVVISLPHFGPPIKLSFKIPFLPEVRFACKIPVPLKHVFNGEHYWEIGKQGFSTHKIRRVLKKYFTIQKEFVPFDNQYHHFFVLDKK